MSEFRLPVLDSNVQGIAPVSTLVFINTTVECDSFVPSEVLGNVNAIVLNPIEDGVAQITTTLNRYRNLEKLHIVSLGSPEGLYLGNSLLTLETFHAYVHPLMKWADSLKPNAAIFLYGCNLVFDRVGMKLLTKLSHLTGVSVAVT